MTAVLETTGLGKLHGEGAAAVTALADVDLTVAQGEFVAVTGPSGCGKSTLLNLLGGLDRPTSGEVLVHGERLAGASEARRARLRRSEVGFVFQFFNLIANLTVADNVELPALLAGVPAREARRRAAELLERLGLEETARRVPGDLSGGQQQRVAIARAGQPPERPARRRADRQPRHRRRAGGRRGAARAPRRRPDDRPRHPRHARGERRPARRGDARRQDRRRDAPDRARRRRGAEPRGEPGGVRPCSRPRSASSGPTSAPAR
jgi:predicted ABC-type transport system involved in lysophospholipase L1 biosynthesis ATPase subunit